MQDMDFSDMLASSIHDIKNSLGLILNSLDDILTDPHNQIANPRQASLLQHEVQRANTNLIQLLTLYKIGNRQLALSISENNLREFLDEIVADHGAVCAAMGLELECTCPPTLNGYFDWELVRGVIGSSIGNAQRYAAGRIRVSAASEDGYLLVRVEDDGTGFPEDLLRASPESEAAAPRSATSSRTRLGLTFADKVARLHRSGQKAGRIQLRNGVQLPGGCFELWLP